jgi:hypothetical protein
VEADDAENVRARVCVGQLLGLGIAVCSRTGHKILRGCTKTVCSYTGLNGDRTITIDRLDPTTPPTVYAVDSI